MTYPAVKWWRWITSGLVAGLVTVSVILAFKVGQQSVAIEAAANPCEKAYRSFECKAYACNIAKAINVSNETCALILAEEQRGIAERGPSR